MTWNSLVPRFPSSRSLLSGSAALLAIAALHGCGNDTGADLDPPVFARAWGSTGSGPGQFNEPRGIAVDGQGNVYVADSYNNRIQKFDEQGLFISAWGTPGVGNGQFENPWAVAVGPEGHVFVTDRNNHRVQKFTPQGQFLAAWGTWGLDDGKFSHPRGVAVDSHGNIYVQEGLIQSDNNRIQKYDAANQFVMAIGTYGRNPGQFDFTSSDGEAPSGRRDVAPRASAPLGNGPRGGLRGVAIDGSDNLYVADLSNHRIQVFSPAGSFLREWGSIGSSLVNYPQALAVDADGQVFLADGNEERQVKMFDSQGRLLLSWGAPGDAPGKFGSCFGGIAVDGQGNVFVADASNNRVQKFTFEGSGKARSLVTSPN